LMKPSERAGLSKASKRSVALNSIRKICSGDRVRYIDGEFDLDLTYITSQVVAMAFPAAGLSSAWRNHIDDVANMLNKYHKNHYMIWNLSDKQYDYSKFDDNIFEFGFPDHHSPPLDMLFKIILTMYNWLKADPKNVAVVHCVGGKGRTGTVICCYLYFIGLFQDSSEAMEYFAQKRSKIENGVRQPSQRRYVGYFDEVLHSAIRPITPTIQLTKIILHTVPVYNKKKKGCSPCLKVFLTSKPPGELVYSSAWEQDISSVFYRPADEKIEWDIHTMVRADLMITCTHVEGSNTTLMFRSSLHTAFVRQQEIIPLEELDGVKMKKAVYIDEGMYLEILFCLDSSTSSSTDDSNAHDISQTVYAAVFSEYEKTRNAQMEAQND